MSLKVIYDFRIDLNRNWILEIYYGFFILSNKYLDDFNIIFLYKQNNEIYYFIMLSV